ncbi:MAG: WYL domain-containing protein [Vallitalea sp.]|nr:WYL domain-containing protein [Vallitalea sp.]
MSNFNELIKNYEKIRDYVRDFHVYGYKCRNDYSSKSGRSYDNERRRIESYLDSYVQYEYTPRGKQLYITADMIDLQENPLFDTWMTKTFTRNDIVLHFIILDILREYEALTINEIADIIVRDYLNHFEEAKIPDTMTIRNKLNEYVNIGFLLSNKKGRTLCYSISKGLLDDLTMNIIKKLSTACGYYQNVSPIGVLGHFIRLQLDKSNTNSLFSFRHIYLAHTLDDEVMLNILLAIQDNKVIELISVNRRNSTKMKNIVLPIKILVNVSTGRRYLICFNYKKKIYSTYRLDNIADVIITDDKKNIAEHIDKVESLLNMSYGITFSNKKLEKLKIILYIDEEKEDYIRKRIIREGRHGKVEKISKNTYSYIIEVADVNEMVPWLRTFIGRIISFQCSNKAIESKFIEDINTMYNMYGG